MHRTLRSIAAIALCATALPCFAQALARTANERFDNLDVNHDGGLSKYEVDADTVLAALDGNGDLKISPAELEKLVGPGKDGTLPLDRVRVADRNADELLDIDELERATKMRFEWMDVNGDGNVDLSELQDRFGVPMVSVPR